MRIPPAAGAPGHGCPATVRRRWRAPACLPAFLCDTQECFQPPPGTNGVEWEDICLHRGKVASYQHQREGVGTDTMPHPQQESPMPHAYIRHALRPVPPLCRSQRHFR